MKIGIFYHFLAFHVLDDENTPFKILTPCGTFQKRLVYWGSNVKMAVTNQDNNLLFKTLKKLRPYHWLIAYSDR